MTVQSQGLAEPTFPLLGMTMQSQGLAESTSPLQGMACSVEHRYNTYSTVISKGKVFYGQESPRAELNPVNANEVMLMK